MYVIYLPYINGSICHLLIIIRGMRTIGIPNSSPKRVNAELKTISIWSNHKNSTKRLIVYISWLELEYKSPEMKNVLGVNLIWIQTTIFARTKFQIWDSFRWVAYSYIDIGQALSTIPYNLAPISSNPHLYSCFNALQRTYRETPLSP